MLTDHVDRAAPGDTGALTIGGEMTEARAARERLDVLNALGLAFIESGHPTGETARVLRGCAAGLGVPGAGITMLGKTIVLEHTADDGVVEHRAGSATAIDVVDCARLRALTRIARSVADGELAGAEACAAIDRTRAASTPWWWSSAGLAALAFFIALQVGVGWLPALLAAGVNLVVSVVGHLAGRAGTPRLFTVTAQALTGGVLAVLLETLEVVGPLGAAAAVAVSWLLLVPLPQLVRAVTDLIDSEYLAALTRFANSAMTLSGIAIGAVLTIALGDHTGFERPADVTLPALALPLILLFSAFGAVSNAFANGGRFGLVLPAAVVGLGTAAVNQLLLRAAGTEPLWASTASAVVLGVAAMVSASRLGYPPQVLALMGITGALLPGLTVFHGVVLELAGGSGAAFFTDAAWICVGLGVGVTFGFFAGFYRTGPNRTIRPTAS